MKITTSSNVAKVKVQNLKFFLFSSHVLSVYCESLEVNQENVQYFHKVPNFPVIMLIGLSLITRYFSSRVNLRTVQTSTNSCHGPDNGFSTLILKNRKAGPRIPGHYDILISLAIMRSIAIA